MTKKDIHSIISIVKKQRGIFMSISSEKLYTEPGSEEELELQQEQEKVRRRSNNTGAKTGKGKKSCRKRYFHVEWFRSL